MKADEINRGVLLVYKTRNVGYFNFSHKIFEVMDMEDEARREYCRILRRLANEVDPDKPHRRPCPHCRGVQEDGVCNACGYYGI